MAAQESKLQTKIRKYLEADGWDVNKRIVMSKNGYEDLECFKFPGRAMFIEVKADNKKPDPLQEYWINRHVEMGFVSFFANSFEMFIEKYSHKL